MNHLTVDLPAGLYLVSTPIGNSRDITLRALDVLANADIIAAEDTRTARKLMMIHGIDGQSQKFIAYHDHSKEGVRERIAGYIATGKSVAYVSEAGTPLIADPGYHLSNFVKENGGNVWPIPGPSAVVAALSVSGLPTDRFVFAGFLPSSAAARQTVLMDTRTEKGTLVFYESPKRIAATLTSICEIMGSQRPVVISRELTKKFEEVLHGTAESLSKLISEKPLKGEIVLLIGQSNENDVDEADVIMALKDAIKTMRVKDAATAVSGAFGLPRRDVYQMALSLKDEG